MDTKQLLGSPNPVSATNSDTILSPEELDKLLEAKRENIRGVDYLQPVVVKHGMFNTEQGLLITSDEALKLREDMEAERRRKLRAEAAAEARKAAEDCVVRIQRRAERWRFDKWALANRVKKYDVHEVLSRPLKVRIAAAKQRGKVNLTRNSDLS